MNRDLSRGSEHKQNNDGRIRGLPQSTPKGIPTKISPASTPVRFGDIMYRGYFPLWRKIVDWGWYQDSNTKAVFIHLLLLCNHKETHFKGQVVYPGQCVTGRKKLSADLGLSERQIRTALQHLKSTNEIAIEVTTKYSVISLRNFSKYLPENYYGYTKSTNKKSNKRPTNDQQTTTPNNVKNDKNDNIYRESITHPPYVSISKEEQAAITVKYGISILNQYITRLNDYIEQIGVVKARGKYKSHAAVIRNWMRRDGVKTSRMFKPEPKKEATPEEREKVAAMIRETTKKLGAK